MKKHFNKELMITKKGNEDFENFTKFWICGNIYVDDDVKVKDHCRMTGKYRGSAHINCNINVKLNHKISIVFHNQKNHDSHIIMQEPGKFNFKKIVILIGLEKYMSFKAPRTAI